MAAKRIAFDNQAREAIRRGVSQLARAVKVTLGPRGRNVMIERGIGAPLVTKDGVTVAREMEFPDSWENMGAQLVKEVASRTSDGAGDGTTTATVLAEAIFGRGLRAIQSGVRPVQLKRGIDKAADKVVAYLKEHSKDVSGTSQIAQVGGIAANNDISIGTVLAEAMEKVGNDGVITVDEGNSLETEVEFVEGMSFDRGYLSPYFITDRMEMTCELEEPLLLFVDGKISSVRDLIPVMELVLAEQKPLLIIAEAVEGEALTLLVVNRLRGALKCCAVKSPGFGDDRKAQLQDMAILTGGKLVSKDTGLTLEQIKADDLGTATKVVVRKDGTEVIGSEGSDEQIKARLVSIKAELERTDSPYERDKLDSRIGKLSGGVARILVGASTEPEMKEKKARVEDAIHATRAAVEEGILPGGGTALLRASLALDGMVVEDGEEIGVAIIKHALRAPICQIARNAGLSPEVVVKTVLENSDPSYGFDAEKLEYCDLPAAGILDPTKVSRTAFINAVSVSTLLLTTDCLVGEIPKEGPKDHDGEDYDEFD